MKDLGIGLRMKNNFYVYIYLDQRYPGKWVYKNVVFPYKPFYIGKGNRFRIIMHLIPSMLRCKTLKSSIIKAIKSKLNELPIHYKVFENLTEVKASIIEISMIKHFGRQDNKTGILANHTDGGDGQNGCHVSHLKQRKKIYQYSLDGDFIKQWNSGKELREVGGLNPSNIPTAVKRGGTAYNFLWSYNFLGYKINSKIKYQMPIKHKSIKQIDKKTNQTIATFKGTGEIIRMLNLPENARTHLLECIAGKLKSAYGFIWVT